MMSAKLIKPALLALCFLAGFFLQAYSQLVVPGYTNQTLHGYLILVEDAAMANDSAATARALGLIDDQLAEINSFCISPEIIDSLQAVPIFVDWNTTNGGAVYHPSETWLINNGYPPQKARSVEISNVINFYNWSLQNQPYIVLHEMAHAFMHRVHNNNIPALTNAYNAAILNGIYDNVQYHQGGGNYSTASAYAKTNVFEYFAELSEAYFGLNDFYPFIYSELMTHDAPGFNAVFDLWGDIKIDSTITQYGNDLIANETYATAYQWLDCDNGNAPISGETQATFTPTAPGNYAVEIHLNGCSKTSDCLNFNSTSSNSIQEAVAPIRFWPNPVRGRLFVDLGEDDREVTSVAVLDLAGKVLFERNFDGGTGVVELDLEGLPAGLGLLRVVRGGEVILGRVCLVR